MLSQGLAPDFHLVILLPILITVSLAELVRVFSQNMTRSSSYLCAFCGIQSDESSIIPGSTSTSAGDPAQAKSTGSDLVYPIHDKSSIEERLSYVQNQLDTLTKAIENLRIAHSSLEQEKEQLKRSLTISPINHTPPELLTQIFIFRTRDWWDDMIKWESRGALLDDHKGWDSEERPRRARAGKYLNDWTLRPARVLSQVCRNWRDMVRSSSFLWSDIYLSPDCDIHAAKRLLLDQIDLSNNQPLRIHTSYQLSSISDSRRNKLYPLLQVITSANQRWNSISTKFTGTRHSLLRRVLTTPTFPSLVSLSILIFSDWYVSYVISAIDAPLLQEASLSWTESRSVTIELPWDRLRKLHLSGCDGERALAIVKQLRIVEELSLHGIHEYDSDMSPTTPLSLTRLYNLNRLNIYSVGFGNRTAGNLLPYLCLPTLKAVDWTQMNARDKVCLETLLCQSSPSGEQILPELIIRTPHRNLYAKREGDQRSPLGDLFQNLKEHLESLEIEYPNHSGLDFNEIVMGLVYSFENNSIPSLRCLKLQGVMFDSWSIKLLLDRIKRDSRYLDVELVGCRFNPQEVHDSTFVFDILLWLQTSAPRMNGRLRVDIEGPRARRLVYSSGSRARIEDGCECKLR